MLHHTSALELEPAQHLAQLTHDLASRTFARQLDCYTFNPIAHAWDLSASYWLASAICWTLQGNIEEALNACAEAEACLDTADRRRGTTT